MTKKGYTHIIVPRDLHARLKALAQAQGLSIATLIRGLLTGINTGINTTQHNGAYRALYNGAQNGFLFSNGDKTVWCGGWDSNPRRPSPEDLKSSPLSWGFGPFFSPFRPGSGTPAYYLSWLLVQLKLYLALVVSVARG